MSLYSSRYNLRSFAHEYSLYFRDDIAFGRCKGCFFSLTLEDSHWRFRIYIGSEQHIGPDALLDSAWKAADYIRWNTTDFIYNVHEARPNAENSALHILENGCIVEISLGDLSTRYEGPERQLRAFVENILPHIAGHTAPNICACCGKPIPHAGKPFYMNQERAPDDFEPAFLPCGAVVPMHAACAESVRETSEKALQAHKERQRHDQRKQRNEFIVLLLVGLIALLLMSKK